MIERTSNDNDDAPRAPSPNGADGYGEAAMILVETLIHSLIDRSVITLAEAIETVEQAVEVKLAIATDRGDSAAAMRNSLSRLEAISRSLRIDLDSAGH